MTIKRYLGLGAGAAVIAGGAVMLDPMIGSNIFSLPEWVMLQSQTQTAPASRGALAQVLAPAPAAPSPTTAPQPSPTAPQRIETIVYDSWTVTCQDTVAKSSKKICSATLQVIEQKQRQLLLTWTIGRDNQGVLRIVVQTPTGVQIAKGVELKLGKASARILPYVSCEPQRCHASIAMNDGMVKDALVSSDAVVTILAVDGRAINFNFPVKGIDKVFAAIGR